MNTGMPIELKDLTKDPAYQAMDRRIRRDAAIDRWLPRVLAYGLVTALVVLGALWLRGGAR